MTRPASDLDGFRLWPGLLDRAAQEALCDEVFARMRAGPLYIPRMPKSGQPMRVRMTNFGALNLYIAFITIFQIILSFMSSRD